MLSKLRDQTTASKRLVDATLPQQRLTDDDSHSGERKTNGMGKGEKEASPQPAARVWEVNCIRYKFKIQRCLYLNQRSDHISPIARTGQNASSSAISVTDTTPQSSVPLLHSLALLSSCSRVIMLSRNPTRIDLKAEDMAELDEARDKRQQQQQKSSKAATSSTAAASSSSSSQPTSFLHDDKRRTTQQRIGYTQPQP